MPKPDWHRDHYLDYLAGHPAISATKKSKPSVRMLCLDGNELERYRIDEHNLAFPVWFHADNQAAFSTFQREIEAHALGLGHNAKVVDSRNPIFWNSIKGMFQGEDPHVAYRGIFPKYYRARIIWIALNGK